MKRKRFICLFDADYLMESNHFSHFFNKIKFICIFSYQSLVFLMNNFEWGSTVRCLFWLDGAKIEMFWFKRTRISRKLTQLDNLLFLECLSVFPCSLLFQKVKFYFRFVQLLRRGLKDLVFILHTKDQRWTVYRNLTGLIKIFNVLS